MNDFQNTTNITYGGTLAEKQDALALDFLNSGKTVDFVLTNVAGQDNKARARIIVLAQQHQFIPMPERVQMLASFKIDETGRKGK